MTEHVANLRERREQDNTPIAEFVGPQYRQRFHQIVSGTDSEFLAAASTIAVELQSRMDRRARPGLFVAARMEHDGSAISGVFKLDVTDKLAGALQQSSGRTNLRAVENLLETPGKLQKGAVTPDDRPDSEVIVGDKLPDAALYFLEALGIRQAQRDTQAVSSIVTIVAQVSAKPTTDVADALAASVSTDPSDFVAALPDLSEPQRREILQRLAQQRRPVRTVSPAAANRVKHVIRGGGITVSGIGDDFRQRVSVRRRNDGRWEVIVIMDEEPRRIVEI